MVATIDLPAVVGLENQDLLLLASAALRRLYKARIDRRYLLAAKGIATAGDSAWACLYLFYFYPPANKDAGGCRWHFEAAEKVIEPSANAWHPAPRDQCSGLVVLPTAAPGCGNSDHRNQNQCQRKSQAAH